MTNLLKYGLVALVAAVTVLPTIAPDAQAKNSWQNRALHRYYSPRYRTPYYGNGFNRAGWGGNYGQMVQKGNFTNQINSAVNSGYMTPAEGNAALVRGF